MTTTRQGPALTITGTCEGCAHVVDDRGGPLCALMGPPRGLIDRITFSLRIDWRTPEWCPLLPAARLALARSIVAEADAAPMVGFEGARCRGADTREDYDPGRVACMVKTMAKRWATRVAPLCADCGDPLADPTTADECSIRHGAGESEE